MSLVTRHAFPIAACALVFASWLSTGAETNAQTPRRTRWYQPFVEESQPDVFYNFYVPGNGGNPAAAYPTPYPTPPRVGHTYFTYQPFMPHEWMYTHHRSYYQYYNRGRGMNRTKIHWYAPPVLTALRGLHKAIELPR